MSYIATPDDVPGIRGLFRVHPEVAPPIAALTNLLLHAPNSLTAGERELIGARVSALNQCAFCQASHSAIAGCLLGDDALVDAVVRNPETADVSERLKALLAIADRVQRSGRDVTAADVDRARRAGATDRDVHDTVLIAALFCMFNRYVDGLGATTPTDAGWYRDRARLVAEHGYSVAPPPVAGPA